RIWWFVWNEPSPLPSRTSTAGFAPLPARVRARSGRPSRLKSPATTDRPAPPLTAVVTAGWNGPLPVPSRTLTLLWEGENDPAWTTARSGLPSRLKSATVTSRGLTPTGNVAGGRNAGTVRSSSASIVNVCGLGERGSGRDFFSKRRNQDRAMNSLQKEIRGA